MSTEPTTSREPIGAWPLNEAFPALLTGEQLARVFDISPATYFRLKQLGRFARFELSPPLLGSSGRIVVRYSGALVREYVSGQSSHARVFGAARRRA